MTDLDQLKARIAPGDRVRFEFRGQRLSGAVSACGPRRAGVVVGAQTYRVPYERIRPAARARDYATGEQGALQQCRALLAAHGLRDWSAGLDDAVSRAGACDYAKKRVTLSRFFVRTATARAIRDTILHEIAHALAGPAHHHDPHWQRIARDIGCSGERCHNIRFAAPRWIMRCPGGCFADTRNRRTRGLFCRRCQRAVHFVAWSEAGARALGLVTQRAETGG